MLAGSASGLSNISPWLYSKVLLWDSSISGIGSIYSDLRTVRPVKTESVASCSVGVSVLRKAVAVLMMAVVGT